MRGVTLPEMLVAGALMLVVLSGLTWLLLLSYRYQRSLALSLELQETTLTAVAALSREVSESNPASLRSEASPVGIVFGSPRDLAGRLRTNDQGRLMWHKYVCIYVAYLNGVACLCRREELLPAPQDSPPVLPPDKTVAYFVGQSTPVTVLARRVDLFEVTGSSPAKFRLAVAARLYDQDYRVETQIDVLPRN
ncbi:MAG: hypothetical protein AB1758_00735 [Candidatus Eremiobacterota bacterium]